MQEEDQEYREKLAEWEAKMEDYNFEKGQLYFFSNTKTIDGIEKEYFKVLLCTGRGEMPTWGCYPTFAGVMVKNTNPMVDNFMMVGSHSTTWNAKELNKLKWMPDVVINNDSHQKPYGECQG